MSTLARMVSSTLVILLAVGTSVQAQNLASNIAIHINRQDNPAPTPIGRQYLALIDSARGGDEIILLQKYFRNKTLNQAIVNAAGRGVKVLGIYGGTIRPGCEKLLPSGSPVDCSWVFIRGHHVHHKSMVLHRSNGKTTAIIGSFNLRERDETSPRAHSVLSFDVEADDTFFPFYKAHADSLRNHHTDKTSFLSLATAEGGRMEFSFYPVERNPVEELLRNLSQCDGPLWLSFYHAKADAIGKPVFARLAELAGQGCDVRFLLNRQHNNRAAVKRLKALGVSVHYPDDRDGKLTLGHKVVMVRSGGRLHFIQSSANLAHYDHRYQYNLSVYLSGDYPAIEQALNQELSRYW